MVPIRFKVAVFKGIYTRRIRSPLSWEFRKRIDQTVENKVQSNAGTECDIIYIRETMIQKQISFPEKLNRQIKQRAKLLQESEERVIRDLLYLGLIKSVSSWKNSGDALLSLGKLGIEGPADLAQKHDDDYLS